MPTRPGFPSNLVAVKVPDIPNMQVIPRWLWHGKKRGSAIKEQEKRFISSKGRIPHRLARVESPLDEALMPCHPLEMGARGGVGPLEKYEFNRPSKTSLTRKTSDVGLPSHGLLSRRC